MINIFKSTSIRQSSTAQDLLNDLANQLTTYFPAPSGQDPWYTIVGTSPSISEIWVSEKIYITLTTDSAPKVKICHLNGISQTATSVITKYSIVTTDKGMMVTNETTSGMIAFWFAIGKTTDPNGVSSHGIVFDGSTGAVQEYTYTDNVTTDSYYYNLGNALAKSRENTVFAPIYSITGDEYFDDLMFVILSKDIDAGRVILNNKYYYINEAIALPYTL